MGLFRRARRSHGHPVLWPLWAVLLVSFTPELATSAGETDSSRTSGASRSRHDALDYVFAVPSFALQLPFRVLGVVVSGPVKLVEDQDFLESLKSVFSFDVPFGLRPVVGSSSRTGLRGGLQYRARSALATGVPLRLKGTISTNRYEFLSLRIGGPSLFESPFGMQGEIGARRDTRERYYGYGPSSSADDESNYERRGGFGNVRGFWQITDALAAEGFGEYRHVTPGDGRGRTTIGERDSIVARFPDDDLFGLYATLDLHEFGGAVVLDWRDIKGSPRRGGRDELRVSYVGGDGPGDTTVGFWRIRGEVSQYIELWRGRVFGLRAAAQHLEPGNGTRIPFYELSRLGGSNSLRAYRSGRFTGRDMVLFSAEYRWPVWRAIDAFLFTDQGRVFDDISEDFEFSGFRSAYGGGLRVWNTGGHLELTLAKGREQFRFYLAAGEEF